jgi:ribosomal protein S18 acetylase RimI-like enzyme
MAFKGIIYVFPPLHHRGYNDVWMDTLSDIPVSVRTWCPSDAATCKALYQRGKVAENDTGGDIDDIASAYLATAGNHFWVAETIDVEVVGMIGVQQPEVGIGQIRRLRVAEAWRRRGIGSLLMETALRFCQERQYLKVKLDTFMDEEAAVRLFEKFRFLHDRTKTLGEKQLMYFYLDLYSTGQGRAL